MTEYFEQLLKEKTDGKQSEILYARWLYIKKIIPDALQSVASLFPHYSLHDASHSHTILSNIVRVIGKEGISKLPAIDIWLLLEASYSHDLGMVVSGDKMVEALNSKKFLDFIKVVQEDNAHGLHKYAVKFEIDEASLKYLSDVVDLEYHDGLRFLLAEYFRWIHADRSADIINKPNNELGIETPTVSIPKRIFKVLSKICSNHTNDFSEVLKLSVDEVGVDSEDMHPRFVACMLRIGDLLDIDNNRFSEVMLRTLTSIPVETLTHREKHLAIEKFSAKTSRIDIVARCKTYSSASVTEHWFGYIKSEFNNQLNYWNEIKGELELSSLPMIGQLDVILEGYDFINGSEKPKFSIDSRKAIELIQGAGLYKGAHQAFRELLQNSIDATLLKFWLDKNSEIKFDIPKNDDLLELMEKYPIKIEIDSKPVEGEMKTWNFKINDQGIGISKDDLTFLMKTGSSSKNLKKRKIIENMPVWLRPSGVFGIGFQSIFLLTKKVIITTKSYSYEKKHFIELFSPLSQNSGDVLIKRMETDHRDKPGTTIEFIHSTKAIPDRWKVENEQRSALRIARNFDPIAHQSLDVELGKIIDEIYLFSFKSQFPIELYLDGIKMSLPSRRRKVFSYYDEQNSFEFNFLGTDKFKNGRNSHFFFKNQLIESPKSFEFLDIEINIHKYEASKILEISRNKVKDSAYQEFVGDLYTSLEKVIGANFDNIFKNHLDRIYGSMFYNYYFPEAEKKELLDYWKELVINGVSIERIVNESKVIHIEYVKTGGNNGEMVEFDKGSLSIKVFGGIPSDSVTLFILSKLRKKFKSCVLFGEVNDVKSFTYLEKSTDPDDIKKYYKMVFEDLIRGVSFHSSRSFIPCFSEFNDLRVKDDAFLSYVSKFEFDRNFSIEYPKMLNPYACLEKDNLKFEFQCNAIESYLKWVYDNRFDVQTTREDIEKCVKSFLRFLKIDELNKIRE